MLPPAGDAKGGVELQAGSASDSAWRSANAEVEPAQHDPAKPELAGKPPHAAQPVARKTVSSKSTPNDDASEASTHEAAISEIATPSPNEEFSSGVHSTQAHKGLSARSPSTWWQSPAIRPHLPGRGPADDLAISSSITGPMGGGKASGASSAGMPALVAGEGDPAVDVVLHDPCAHAHDVDGCVLDWALK